MEEPIGIIGAGITGLATADMLSSNHKVTIIARDLPGDLGLNWASPWFVNSFSSYHVFFITIVPSNPGSNLIAKQGRGCILSPTCRLSTTAKDVNRWLQILLGSREE